MSLKTDRSDNIRATLTNIVLLLLLSANIAIFYFTYNGYQISKRTSILEQVVQQNNERWQKQIQFNTAVQNALNPPKEEIKSVGK